MSDEHFSELRALLAATAMTLNAESRTPGAWIGAASSAFQVVQAAEIDGPGGPWTKDVRVLPMKTVAHYSAAIAAHIENLGALLNQPAPVLSPNILVRAIIEVAAKIDWIIDADSGCSPRDHSARALLEKLHVGKEMMLPLKRLGISGRDREHPHTVLKREWRATKSLAESHFRSDEVDIDLGQASSKWSLAGNRLLSPTDLGVRFGKIGNLDGAALYAFLSAAVHPNPILLDISSQHIDDGEKPPGLYLTISDEEVRKLVEYAMVATHRAYGLIGSYLGWQATRFAQWEDVVSRVLPGVFTS